MLASLSAQMSFQSLIHLQVEDPTQRGIHGSTMRMHVVHGSSPKAVDPRLHYSFKGMPMGSYATRSLNYVVSQGAPVMIILN